MNLLGKRLVIFGCGYIGGEIARQAVERSASVVALTRNAEKAEMLRAGGIEVIIDNLCHDSWHGQIQGKFDFVLNAVSSGGAGIEGYRQSYVEGTASILRWLAKCGGGGTVVYTSSTSVYPQDGGVEVHESAATTGASERGRVLLEAERLLREDTGTGILRHFERYFILRLGGIYGPERKHLLEQVRSGSVSGKGENHLNLIHRDDVCAAIWAVFAAPESVRDEIFNVVDDSPARKDEVVAWLATKLRVPSPVFSGLPAGAKFGYLHCAKGRSGSIQVPRPTESGTPFLSPFRCSLFARCSELPDFDRRPARDDGLAAPLQRFG